jgi:5-methylcytosine-specific restriction endonuclease McrA
MDSNNPRKNDPQADQLIAEARRQRAAREKEYREQALRLFPHICARCGREFTGKKLRELTVHHKDHNHDNNPQDGSNWQLLCLYCHDNEHQKYLDQDLGGPTPEPSHRPATTFKPFASLQELLKGKKKQD